MRKKWTHFQQKLRFFFVSYHQNETLPHKNFVNSEIIVRCYRVLFPTSTYFSEEISRTAPIMFTTQNKDRIFISILLNFS